MGRVQGDDVRGHVQRSQRVESQVRQLRLRLVAIRVFPRYPPAYSSPPPRRSTDRRGRGSARTANATPLSSSAGARGRAPTRWRRARRASPRATGTGSVWSERTIAWVGTTCLARSACSARATRPPLPPTAASATARAHSRAGRRVSRRVISGTRYLGHRRAALGH